MRILIVDENADFCTVLREYLRAGLEGAARAAVLDGSERPAPLQVKEWNPVKQGVPEPGRDRFKWNFDAILIDSHIEPADPLDWLARARSSAAAGEWPPVVMLVNGRDDQAMALEAVKLGVVDCIPRADLTPRRLYEALTDAVAERSGQVSLEKTLVTGTYASTVEVDKVGRKVRRGAPQIPGYAIERLIGQGGTSKVYLARREGYDVPVVLKVLLPELSSDANIVERFMQEFSLIQKIKSVHVTRIFDLNYDSGNAYLAMEYFGAGDLRERVAGGVTPVAALKIFAQIARALGAIHDAGVVHRDLKPHNIMFRNQHHLAIVDFGGAKSLGETAGITKVGHIIGTPNYMSPEQITGDRVDKRSDLYSLGVILHLLLTGQPLYVASSATDIMAMHLNAPIPRLPEELNGFQKLLNKLVAKNPDARFQSARELYAYIAY
jgi:serine/threonine-protein kinase PpkA